MSNYEQISKNAEADLNSYQAKTGNARAEGLDDAGVNSYAEKKFANEGANVEYGENLSTNAGYNKRIPPSEGGALDDKGRQATGLQYDGEGGPVDKFEKRDGGRNDGDVVPARVPKVPRDVGSRGDVAELGQAASQSNVGSNPPGVGGSAFRGDDYYQPESVPDSISAEGWMAPDSVTEASRETEGYSPRQ